MCVCVCVCVAMSTLITPSVHTSVVMITSDDEAISKLISSQHSTFMQWLRLYSRVRVHTHEQMRSANGSPRKTVMGMALASASDPELALASRDRRVGGMSPETDSSVRVYFCELFATQN